MWKRVIAPTIVVSIFWIIVSGITTYHIQKIYESHSRILAQDVTTIEAAWAMRRDVWQFQAALLDASSPDLGYLEGPLRQFERSFEASLQRAEATSFTLREQELAKSIRTGFDSYRGHIRRALEHPSSTTDPNTGLDRKEASQLASQVLEPTRQLLFVNQDLVKEEAERNQRLQSTLSVFRYGSLIAGPVIGVLFGLVVVRGLNRSLAKIRITLQGATGELGSEFGSVAITDADDLPALQTQMLAVADRIRRVVAELEEARQRAIQSERLAAVGELAAGVAHEIRNPLTSVKLLIQTASQRPGDPVLTGKQYEVVLAEIMRMEGTIQGLLDFAKPPRPQRIEHDIRQTLHRALNLVQGRAAQARVIIEEANPVTPVTVDADPEQFHQVFVNLALNGIEAMAGGGPLRISIQTLEQSCRISFLDAGPGISPQILPRLFEPFATDKERGTGLGLAISRRIVQEHGGTITATNHPGGGAELTVAMPIVAETVQSESKTVVRNVSAIKFVSLAGIKDAQTPHH